MSESSSATRTRFTRRREVRELEGRSVRSCRDCNGTSIVSYAPPVPAVRGALPLGSWLWRRVGGPPAGSALSATAGVVRRRGAFLLVVVDLLDAGLRVGRELVPHRVEDRLVLRAGGLGESLGRVALVFAIGLAHFV